jgi:hypothetical protein
MELKQLKSLAELLDKGILNQDEFNREKAKILAGSSKHETKSDFTNISKAGQNLLNIFYALLALVVYSVIAVTLLFFDYSYYQTIFLISLFVQVLVLIIVFSNIYLAGKHLKYSVTSNLGNQKMAMSDKEDYEDYMDYLKTKHKGQSASVLVADKCPACEHEFSKLSTTESLTACPNCGLNFN